ncbi:response regulator transcription factor [Rhizobiaceae bacterium n13]|uniref:Response regulator transcription factor n=1 Tax=Ferirhizobium litorale TaxID=2927786 RepID=A0AAE3QEJ7_9HYPH|nr:response regulator transcription factor [Fererhizobium litorale]MDI7861588.1 response regulator transcription factor [Fererhizobium litorale]MDI7922070.1 response regulator transcription factor [Fererhizobium litorale]
MTDARPISVLLVDNHPLVLEGLKAVLETYPDIDVVGTAGNVQAGLAVAAKARPRVILLDINMPQISGIEAIEMFQETAPESKILMLSMHDSREYISASVLRGALGYVLKDVPNEEIVRAIETVAAGNTYFSTGVSDALMQRRPKEESVSLPLTTREREILAHLAAGRSNRHVAELLQISVATVETHRKAIKRKLGISTTAELTRFAIEHGLHSTE